MQTLRRGHFLFPMGLALACWTAGDARAVGNISSSLAPSAESATQRTVQDSPASSVTASAGCRAWELLRLAQAVSNICYTPVVYCNLDRSVPVGTPCWCATPNGPSSGTVR